MSKNQNPDKLSVFIKQVWSGFGFVFGVVSAVLGFVKLAEGNSGLFTLVLLGVGIFILLLVCIFYTWFWEPELADKNSSLVLITNAESRFKSQKERKEHRRKIRYLSRLGLFIIPILLLAVFGIYRHHVQSPAKNFIILVAKFEDSNSKDYSVTQEIFSHLEREMNSYSDVKVEKLDKSLLSIRAAREEGKRKKAAIVIWGRYPIIGKIVPFSVNFEILNQPPEFPELEPAVKGQSQPKAIDQLTSFKLQTTLSQEMTYLSFFTLGMYRYFEEDWEQAIDYLSKAIKVFKNIENQFISDSHLKLVYFHLGNIRGRKGDYQGAINDYNKIIKINSKFYHAYHNRGFAYAKLGDAQSALTDYDLAVKLNPESATTYYNRGLIYGRDLGDYRQALANFTKSIELASDDAQVYVDRGNAYQLLKKIESAVDDYSQAIRINPQHAQAHYNRGIAYSQQNEPEKALQDLQRASTLFQAQGNSANYQRTLDRIREIQRI